MSKTAARAAAAANGNSQTSSNQPVSNQAQAVQAPQGQQSSNQAAQSPQDQQTNGQAVQTDPTDKVAICLEKLTDLSADHEKTLSDHERRLKALEEALAKIRQSNQTVSSTGTSAPAPTSAPTSVPAPASQQQSKSTTIMPGNGYTGKALVFFIHGEDGDIDWARPFYSPNVAKYYDWNYRIIPAWVENGAFVRALKPEEAAGVDW